MIRPKLLGWVVIAYAAFSSGTLLDLTRLFMVRKFENSFDTLLASVIWAAFLIGGVALLLDRRWSKWLVLFAAAAYLIAMVATVAPIAVTGLDHALIPALVADVIPVVLIFFGALFVRIVPADLAARNTPGQVDSTTSARRTKLDIAYACFLWIALVVLVFFGIETIGKNVMTMTDATAAGIGFFVLIPLALASMTVALVGIVFSFMMWRDWRLPVLSVLTGFVLFAAFVFGESHVIGGRAVVVVAAVYVIASLSFGIRWFAFVRKRPG